VPDPTPGTERPYQIVGRSADRTTPDSGIRRRASAAADAGRSPMNRHVEGQNVIFVYRWAEGRPSGTPSWPPISYSRKWT
jgi:hypothetical protein